MASDITREIADVNDLIREGRSFAALRRLRQLATEKIPRENMATVANLAWRVGWANFSVRLLNPLVRPTGKSSLEPTLEEKSEYAAALTFIGAGEEAQSILESLSPESRPEVWLFRSFVLFGQWNYAAAIGFLSNFIASPRISDYQRRVGMVNLLAALVHERNYPRASALVTELLEITKGPGHLLLRGNVLELAAQNAIWQKAWTEAEGFLRQAEFVLRESEGLDRFYVVKWKAILEYLRAVSTEQGVERLGDVRSTAEKREHWETLRDCDRFQAIHSRNPTLLRHVYFGTPFETFRQRLLSDYAGPLEIPESYSWNVQRGVRAKWEVDLLTGQVAGRRAIKLGQLLHRLLVALASDFYRPQRIASLHFCLYPGEFFNPVTSPHRVHEAMRRLRNWFIANELSLGIRERSSQYRLYANDAVALRVYRKPAPNGGKIDGTLRHLREVCGDRPFSSQEAATHLHIPARTVLRILGEACQRNLLVRTGSAASTRYLFRKAG